MKRRGLSRTGKSRIAKLKRKLDIVFSKYIRERDKDEPCVSCPFKGSLQCGHFRRRELMSTRWNEYNSNGQCARCNLWLGGATYEYAKGLEKKYGKGTAEKLYKESQKVKQWTEKELEEKIAYYENLQGI